jgi:hypothetical protein
MYTTQDSTAAGTFSVDFSDRTVYMNIKDNLGNTYASNGIMAVLHDGTDRIGYSVAGNDARGMPQQLFFSAFKLDCSEADTTAGNHAVFAGTEANLTFTAITGVGYGSNHLAKAVGSVDNVIMDGFYDIANGSYALTIDGGTSGTPETMADVLTDDETSGWGLVSNPLGQQYVFFGPTEWGTPSGTADSYFEATNEQWFWMGDNAGGRAVGSTHFPMRLIGNGTGTNSFKLTNVVVVNTGTVSEVDGSNTDMDTVEITLCTFDGLASFTAPVAGTSDFVTLSTFVNCGQVTGNECDFGGSSFLTPTVAADGAAISWDETISTAHTISELDDTTFEMGSNNHHAISFSANVSNGANLTLRNIEFTGFDADGTGDSDNSMIELLATTGTITLTLEGCTVDGAAASSSNFTVDTRAGCSVDIVTGAVTAKVTATTDLGSKIESARVHLRASDDTALPYGDAVTISRTTTTATVTHTGHGLSTNDKVYLRGISDKTEDNGVQQVTVSDVNTYTFTTTDSGSTSYTGSGFIIHNQDETSYDNSPATEGTFSGGTGHAVSDVLTLRGGAKITVDAISSGVVTQFTVDAGDSVGGRSASDIQDQISTTGSGTGFSLTLDTDNIVTEIRSTYVALDGNTDVNGEISISRVFGSNQPVSGWARKSTSSPYYRQGPITSTITSADGMDFTTVMVSDE